MKKFFAILISFLICSSVFAGPIKEIIFFGDSLSDDGNLHNILKIIPKSPPYFKGRFSNGPSWAEYVGKYYYDKNYLSFTNYSYGGATAVLHDPTDDPFIAPTTLRAELQSYYLRSVLKDKSQTLFVIWIGANDYLYEKKADLNALSNSVVERISGSVNDLISKGAKTFLVLNLPELSETPYAREHGITDRLKKLTELHNFKLITALNNLTMKHSDIQIIHFDINQIFVDLLKNPEKYNQKYGTQIKNLTGSCWEGSILGLTRDTLTVDKILQQLDNKDMQAAEYILKSPVLKNSLVLGDLAYKKLNPCSNVEEYIFWDELHPTAIVHKILGQIVIERLESQGVV